MQQSYHEAMYRTLLMLTPLLSAPAFAQVYQGTVGPYPIVLKLEKDLSGKYAYLSQGLSIELKGKQDKQLLLTEQIFQIDTGQYKTTGTFTLKRSGQGWTGSWKAPGRQSTLVVKLQPFKAGKIHLPDSTGLQKLLKADPYTFAILNHPWTTRKDGWVQEPRSKVTYPRVKNALALNRTLQDLQLEEATMALECRSMGGGSDLTSWDSQTTITYQNTTLYSQQTTSSMFCGGAHPSVNTTGTTLDARTGKDVPLKMLWSKLTTEEQHLLYLKAYPRAGEQECLDVLMDSRGSEYTWYLTKNGLALFPNFLPHVAYACAEEVVVPYAALDEYANQSSPYLKTLK